MNIILIGAGKLGVTLARQLTDEGCSLTLVDSDASALADVSERMDVLTLCGNGAVREVLVRAGAESAGLVIAVTGSDEVNLLCCVIAHQISAKLHTIARIRNPEYSNQIYDMRDVFALSMTVNPDRQAAVEIERLLRYPGFLKLDTFARGRVEIAELRVEADSRLCGVRLSEINGILKCRILVCSVLREGEVLTPSGDFTLLEGDRIFVTAPEQNLSLLLRNLGILTRKVRSVMLCGGGRTSFYLAQQLRKSGIQVKLIEVDRDRCKLLAGLLPDVTILHGDASSQKLLESEGIDDCDALISLTGMDEVNMMISLYGHSHGVPQVITKLARVEDSRILDTLPLGSIISPKALCCSSIVRYVRALRNQTGAATAVHFIADGKAEAIEFQVDSATPHTGEPLKALKLRKNLLIACIARGTKTEIPNGDSSFHPGDTVIVVTSRSNTVLRLSDICE